LRSCLSCDEARFHDATLDVGGADHGKEYIYTDLRCLQRGQMIRLIVLEPGGDEEPVRCTIALSGLQHSNFDAVSYIWATEEGDDTKTQKIRVDGSLLLVTKICEAALRCLRRRQVRQIWIDAMCINQANTKERNHQVGLMDRIYKSATRIHICINDFQNNYDAWMHWIQFGDIPERSVETLHARQTTTPHDMTPGEAQQQLETLFRCRYFSRTWII